MKTIEQRTDEFESNLRELSYDAYCIFEDLKEQGSVDMEWQHISHVLEKLVVQFFGGYNAPESD